jgi:hypothetical protein
MSKIVTAKNLPLSEITATELPGLNGAAPKKGFKVAGAWLNGSDRFSDAKECQEFLIGKELTYSQSGKSLVVVGDFQPINGKILKGLINERDTVVIEAIDLSQYI